MTFLTKLFWNYVYSGRDWEPVQSRQVSFINSFSLIGVSAAIGFGMYRLLAGEYVAGEIEIAAGVLGLLNILYLRKSFNAHQASAIILLIMMGLLAFLFVDGGIAGTGIYWMFTFPVLAFFLLDDKLGLRWNLGLLSVLVLILLARNFGLVEIPYEWVVLRQAFFSFSAVVGLLYFYTKFTGINAHVFVERTRNLEESFNAKKQQIEMNEKALKIKLDNFFQTASDLMCLASKEGYFIEINPAFTKVLGYTVDELLKIPFIDFVHPEDKEKTNQAMGKLANGEVVENFTNRYRRKDGGYSWFMWNATPYEDVIYAIAHPVDDLMGAQEKLKAKVVELENLNRLMVDREITMINMKKELAAIKGESKTI